MPKIRLKLVVAGGQTGADQGGLRAARSLHFPTGGYAPLGWLTEDGPAPWLELWGLEECGVPGYAARTRANAHLAGRKSGMLIWFGSRESRGCKATLKACEGLPIAKLFVVDGETTPRDAYRFIEACWVSPVLLVAGNRESLNPGISTRVERFMTRVLTLVRAAQEAE